MTGTIAITMAGMGSRFTRAGYDRPKYEIMANGISLFDWSMYSLEAFRQAGWTFYFIARSGLDAPEFIRHRAKALGKARYEIYNRVPQESALTILKLDWSNVSTKSSKSLKSVDKSASKKPI